MSINGQGGSFDNGGQGKVLTPEQQNLRVMAHLLSDHFYAFTRITYGDRDILVTRPTDGRTVKVGDRDLPANKIVFVFAPEGAYMVVGQTVVEKKPAPITDDLSSFAHQLEPKMFYGIKPNGRGGVWADWDPQGNQYGWKGLVYQVSPCDSKIVAEQYAPLFNKIDKENTP